MPYIENVGSGLIEPPVPNRPTCGTEIDLLPLTHIWNQKKRKRGDENKIIHIKEKKHNMFASEIKEGWRVGEAEGITSNQEEM